MTKRRDSVLENRGLRRGPRWTAEGCPQGETSARRERVDASSLALCVAAGLLAAVPVSAHDRHANVTVNQSVHVQIEKDHVDVSFQIDTNQEGTFVEAVAMDVNGDGKLSSEEQSAYFAQLDARLREGLRIRVEEIDISLDSKESVELTPPARKTFHFGAALPANLPAEALLLVFNDNFLDWPGKGILNVEPGPGVVVHFGTVSSVHMTGSLTLLTSTPAAPMRPVTWWLWSWRNTFVSPLGATLLVILLAALILVVAFRHRLSGADFWIVSGLLFVGLVSGILFIFARNPNPASEAAWRWEFRSFHERLTNELVSLHQGAGIGELPKLCDQDALKHLVNATRIISRTDDSSGSFHLHGLRHVSTVIHKTPHNVIDPIFRVHHEWRTVGLMKHDGHSHERVRNFSCDYTLRVTDQGFQLLDCSNWHQLPDEPVE